jgi:hypothetical protein
VTSFLSFEATFFFAAVALLFGPADFLVAERFGRATEDLRAVRFAADAFGVFRVLAFVLFFAVAIFPKSPEVEPTVPRYAKRQDDPWLDFERSTKGMRAI